MWRTLHGILPFDDYVWNLGIPIMSKCNCLTVSEEKTVDHVMSTCLVAAYVGKQAVGMMEAFNVEG